ncbi:MAG: hypothetical protein ACPK85_00825 [Methanosarcina sp.]
MDKNSKVKNIILQGQEIKDNYNETLSMLDDENIEKYFRNRLFSLKATIARITRKTQGKDIAYDFEALNSRSMSDLDEIENEQTEALKGFENLKSDIRAYKQKYKI